MRFRVNREDRRPNILLITCDQLRSDYLGCYGADEKGAIRILETRSEIGRYIGRDPRSVDRIIQKLREQGYVGGSHRKITVTEEQHRRLLDLVEELTL